ncbi:OmpH family outer membrane protein [Siccirubricoccus sp. KC 17139]|uniref:OmpH family outer membrane protein n=1 Tax=Siccirubricoccus soli TaxID=2899147 RepID=A0ABT1DD13_9PROT|nr:OmpH family outer membrane protein [Siccirubricoccus soli]MCO6419069.1 OmpH family outer membrane protein [Siccirubricoccus soli]MCP2685204.1 OmpH family outer membrane protein [Siccirubricoccus soli]
MPVHRTAARLLLAAGLAAAAALPAVAQQGQGQEWFVPGQGGNQSRPTQAPAQRPAQRPAQAQRPPAALPPGQQPPTAVIGIVDVPEIQRVSTAFNQVREEIEKRREKLNGDLQREQARWRDEQTALANQRASLPPDQLRQRERDLQDRITDSQRVFRERSRAIEQVAQQALVEIEQGLGQVIRQVAASRHVNMVLPRPLVIFNDPAFDLTEEVSTKFNQTLRSVTLPPESASGEATPQASSAPPARPAAPAPAAPRR